MRVLNVNDSPENELFTFVYTITLYSYSKRLDSVQSVFYTLLLKKIKRKKATVAKQIFQLPDVIHVGAVTVICDNPIICSQINRDRERKAPPFK